MSRIDQALSIREGVADPAASGETDVEVPGSAALNRFSREQQPDDVGKDPRPANSELDTGEALPAERSRLRAVRRGPSHSIDPQLRARLVTSTASAVSVEQYRRLAAVLHDAQEQSQLKSVMITSALPGDGKTLTVANLALTLSESYGRRVLVIDADLRLPTLHAVLGIANGSGLSEALRGDHELAFVEVAPGLTALTAGTPDSSPLAGLSSNRMRDIVLKCEERFDWVLIDTSPAGVLPDAQVIGRLVGGVLLVVGAGTTPAETVEHAIAQLGGADSIFGIVLNRVDDRRIPQADYYGQYRPGGSGK